MTEDLIEGSAPAAGVDQIGSANVPVDAGDSLFASLGLDQVDADPNALPDGKYDGVVVSADLAVKKADNKVLLIITYRVEDGDRKGARMPHIFNLGINPVLDDEGNVKAFTPTMTDGQKQWLKKAFVDLGIPEAQASSTPRSALVGRECTFGVRKRDGFRNVTFVEPRGNSLMAQQVATGQVAQAPNAAVQEQAQAPGELPPF